MDFTLAFFPLLPKNTLLYRCHEWTHHFFNGCHRSCFWVEHKNMEDGGLIEATCRIWVESVTWKERCPRRYTVYDERGSWMCRWSKSVSAAPLKNHINLLLFCLVLQTVSMLAWHVWIGGCMQQTTVRPFQTFSQLFLWSIHWQKTKQNFSIEV